MDILADLMRSVGMNPSVLTQNDIVGDWGILFPATQSAGFHIVRRGGCFLLAPCLEQAIPLESGDMVFISRGTEHTLVSEIGVPAPPLPEFLKMVEQNAQNGGTTKSQAGPVTTLVCGVYHFEVEPIHPFFTDLPEIIHFPSHEVSAQHPMHSALMLLSAELEQPGAKPGDSVVVERLVDVMFCYILRQWMELHPKEGASWIHAFYDDHLRDSLVAIHQDPAYNWSVEELACKAHLSRAAFAQRFKSFVNDTPIQYLAKVRVQKAMELLYKSEENIESIAETVGYSTGFALSKAFKRIHGISPKQFRQKAA